ncbi:MAG: ABC transporter ATP-binding protein [Flavobacteriaceae bacterium]|nr:ABC transporter ATP-binding protein [Flavobacteriaceae bacterium]
MSSRHQSDRDIPKAKLSMATLKKSIRLFKYMSGSNRWWFLLGTLFLAISAGASLAFPQLLGQLMDGAFIYNGKGISKAPDTSALEKIAGYFVYLFIIQAVFSFARIAIYVRVTEDMTFGLRTDLFAAVIRQNMSFHNQNRVGELLSRFSADIAQIQDAFTTNLAMFIRQILILVGGIIVLFVGSSKLAVMMLATLPAIIVFALLFGRFIRKKSKAVQDITAANSVIVEESLSGIVSVKSFTNEEFENERYRKNALHLKHNSISRGYWRGIFSSFIIICMFGAIVWLIYQGLGLVQSGEMAVGELFNFMILTAFVGTSIGGMAEQFVQLQKTLGSIESVLDIIDMPGEALKISKTHNPPSAHKNIQSTKTVAHILSPHPNWQSAMYFQEICFAYPSRPESTVLKEISLCVNPGDVLALVGPSGSGKSTIANLLYQFYQPTRGKILLGDTDITQFNLQEYREAFALVPQDVMLFGGSIYDNIRYGKPDASPSEIKSAAEQANAKDFIESFPEKYETLVGDRGLRLSGGQKQRVAMARAILRNPKVLILDEATSALDSESEIQVQNALRNLMKNRTSIVIAHRLSTIRHANIIAVVKEGAIIEKGNHSALMKIQGGHYRRMVDQQIDPLEFFGTA